MLDFAANPHRVRWQQLPFMRPVLISFAAVGTWNKCYLNCIVGSPSGLMEIAEVFWFRGRIMRSDSLACFCEGGNVIAVAEPGEAFLSLQSKVSMCWHEGGEGVTEMDLK